MTPPDFRKAWRTCLLAVTTLLHSILWLSSSQILLINFYFTINIYIRVFSCGYASKLEFIIRVIISSFLVLTREHAKWRDDYSELYWILFLSMFRSLPDLIPLSPTWEAIVWWWRSILEPSRISVSIVCSRIVHSGTSLSSTLRPFPSIYWGRAHTLPYGNLGEVGNSELATQVFSTSAANIGARPETVRWIFIFQNFWIFWVFLYRKWGGVSKSSILST